VNDAAHTTVSTTTTTTTTTMLARRLLSTVKQASRSCTRRPAVRFTSTQQESGSNHKKLISPLLLICPATAFGLGCWQVKRLHWKTNLLQELHDKINGEAIPLPDDILHPGRIEELEFTPVTVRGTFDHSKEIYLGPRSRLDKRSGAGGGVISDNSSSGYQIVTPLVLEKTGERILVNRGWVPMSRKKADARPDGQVEGVVEVRGIVRTHENKGKHMVEVLNQSGTEWHYRDVENFSIILKTLPVFIDADKKSSVKGGPIGGQTPVYLRNEHMQYIVTWYSLAAITTFMWIRYRRNPHLL